MTDRSPIRAFLAALAALVAWLLTAAPAAAQTASAWWSQNGGEPRP